MAEYDFGKIWEYIKQYEWLVIIMIALALMRGKRKVKPDETILNDQSEDEQTIKPESEKEIFFGYDSARIKKLLVVMVRIGSLVVLAAVSFGYLSGEKPLWKYILECVGVIIAFVKVPDIVDWGSKSWH